MPYLRFFGESTARRFAYDLNLPLPTLVFQIDMKSVTLCRRKKKEMYEDFLNIRWNKTQKKWVQENAPKIKLFKILVLF